MRSSYPPVPFDTRFLNPTAATQLVRLPYWRLAILLVVAHLVQTTWLQNAEFFGVHLDLVFLVAVSTALLGGTQRGAWAGLGAGYLDGLAAMWHPGSFIFSRLVPCVCIGSLSPRIGVSHPLAPPLAAALGTIGSDLIFLMLSPTDLPLHFWLRHALVAALLHGLFIWPVFALCQRLLRSSQRLSFR